MVIDELERAWRAWAELGTELDDQQWRLPTRLPGWTVRDVFAHHSGFPAAVRAGVEVPEPQGPVTHEGAAQLLSFMQQPGGVAAQTANTLRDHAVEHANARSTAELVEPFTTLAPAVIAELRQRDLGRRVDYGGLAVLTAGEALRIFLMEAVVHYFDMALALDRPVPGPMAGPPVGETARLLVEMADPVALIDAATGRGQPRIFPLLR